MSRRRAGFSSDGDDGLAGRARHGDLLPDRAAGAPEPHLHGRRRRHRGAAEPARGHGPARARAALDRLHGARGRRGVRLGHADDGGHGPDARRALRDRRGRDRPHRASAAPTSRRPTIARRLHRDGRGRPPALVARGGRRGRRSGFYDLDGDGIARQRLPLHRGARAQRRRDRGGPRQPGPGRGLRRDHRRRRGHEHGHRGLRAERVAEHAAPAARPRAARRSRRWSPVPRTSWRFRRTSTG